ncbi:MAG TPA: glutamine synthetase family protein [Woeseiaceae bacterium]|nr:glutamine synthetase family protein [Woeseiaceae bacterium]
MTKRKAAPRNRELEQFLRKYPGTDVMELLIPDMAGVLRCKRARAHEFAKIFSDGFCMPGGTVFLDTLGNTVPGIRFGAEDGDPDINVRVVDGSLVPVPWARRPSAQAMVRFETRDGEPFFGDPRAVLQRAAAPMYKLVSKIVTAVELEFYLLDADAPIPTPVVSKILGTGRGQPGPQVYHPDDLWNIEDFLNDLNDACAAQALPIGTTISEFAPGQFEVNLHHVPDPVLACDHAVLLKRVIKAVAREHGFVACFMAKPFEDQSGSGLHIHMSMLDGNGRNYFSQGKEKMAGPPFSPQLRHAIGGLKQTMAEATAIFAPNANSYRRLRPEMYAPVEPNWGINHRKVSLRVPIADEKNLRFEHRTSGADANPYLVTAAILAGVHYGLENRSDPGEMVPEGAIIELKRKIPNRWDAAIDLFSKSTILPQYLGEDYCRTFAINRREEARRFHNTISPVDFDWYLRAV